MEKKFFFQEIDCLVASKACQEIGVPTLHPPINASTNNGDIPSLVRLANLFIYWFIFQTQKYAIKKTQFFKKNI